MIGTACTRFHVFTEPTSCLAEAGSHQYIVITTPTSMKSTCERLSGHCSLKGNCNPRQSLYYKQIATSTLSLALTAPANHNTAYMGNGYLWDDTAWHSWPKTSPEYSKSKDSWPDPAANFAFSMSEVTENFNWCSFQASVETTTITEALRAVDLGS